MGLPRIAPYALPRPDEIPESRVPWRLEARRAALLVHDMQAYFARAFPADAPPLPEVVANIAALRKACAAARVPVFFTAQPAPQDPRDRGLQADFWGPGMTAEADAAIVDALAPAPGELVLTKWRYSAFQRTNLEAMLRARGRDQLLVTGVYAHIGCLLTAADAFMRDVQPFFVVDAVADFSREKHDLAASYAAERCAAPASTAGILDLI